MGTVRGEYANLLTLPVTLKSSQVAHRQSPRSKKHKYVGSPCLRQREPFVLCGNREF